MSPQHNHTFIGFDFGIRKIGIAIGQDITATARPLKTLYNTANGQPDWSAMEKIIEAWRPQALIIGVPFNMDGTKQTMTRRARHFGSQLQNRYNLPVYEMDERLSTREAREIDREYHNSRKKNTANQIDSIAAALILQTWFNNNERAG